jgi:hypothetical protein
MSLGVLGVLRHVLAVAECRVGDEGPQCSVATSGRVTMAQCETCGNDYDKAFAISIAGKSHTFDSFECAIQALAPTCDHCGCRIIGHGVEADGTMYCCAHCASQKRVTAVRDRV